MNLIEKKIWPEYFEKVLMGTKNFEVRLADFEIKEGDLILLREWNPKNKNYTGREIKKQVTYITNTKGMEKIHTKEELEKYGLVIIGMKSL
ncbi:MAG: DUF3850 domain-containing protein [archaeon]|jgi:ASC-1-like (ASCH) protein